MVKCYVLLKVNQKILDKLPDDIEGTANPPAAKSFVYSEHQHILPGKKHPNCYTILYLNYIIYVKGHYMTYRSE